MPEKLVRYKEKIQKHINKVILLPIYCIFICLCFEQGPYRLYIQISSATDVITSGSLAEANLQSLSLVRFLCCLAAFARISSCEGIMI